jgi:hypothetical protein
MSELRSQVPVVATSKADAIARLTVVNPNEATGSDEIRPWTPYNRRSLPIRNSFTGSSKRIRKVKPLNATRFPFSSEAVDKTEAREIHPVQESRTRRGGLLVDSMAMTLLQEVNHILEQERHAHSENSVRVASKATSTGDETKQVNPDYGRSFPIRNDAIDSEAIGQVNYCCCEWWLATTVELLCSWRGAMRGGKRCCRRFCAGCC